MVHHEEVRREGLKRAKKTQETITAPATASGQAGVGIIRVSGPLVSQITEKLIGTLPKPRHAVYAKFLDDQKNIIDQGLVVYFPGPNSFTGEDVVEFQGHGGQVVLTMLMNRIIELGARLARPGEFSERAFLNDKIDLTQAEAIADLISANSEKAARSAMRSLQGEFSEKIKKLVEQLIELRIYVEAAIDFPEEEIDFLADDKISNALEKSDIQLKKIINTAQQGALLRDGVRVVIAGKPNAGKSSLLNALSGEETAIVTDVPGTTRDIIRQSINIDGLTLHVTDTAGLRHSKNIVEQEGVRRAWSEIESADVILIVIDETNTSLDDMEKEFPELFSEKNKAKKIFFRNKIDLLNKKTKVEKNTKHINVFASAKTGAGITDFKKELKKLVGFEDYTENTFIARQRHVDALNKAADHLTQGKEQLHTYKAGELLAEELRLAQQSLSEITGQFTSDDLLGRIFSSFCIGK